MMLQSFESVPLTANPHPLPNWINKHKRQHALLRFYCECLRHCMYQHNGYYRRYVERAFLDAYTN